MKVKNHDYNDDHDDDDEAGVELGMFKGIKKKTMKDKTEVSISVASCLTTLIPRQMKTTQRCLTNSDLWSEFLK